MTSTYSQPFIHHFTGLFGTNTVGLLAQLVEHYTGIAKVIGFKSRTGLNFFKPSCHYYLSNVHYCEDRFHIHVFIFYLKLRFS